MKPAALFLSAYLPSATAGQAGQKTAFRHLMWLAQEYDVTLIAFRNEADREADVARLDDYCSSIKVFVVGNRDRLVGGLTHPLWPFLVAARWNRDCAEYMRRLADAHQFARVHLEWTQMTIYRQFLRPGPQVTLYVHDVLTQWAERRAQQRSVWWRLEAWRCRRWEATAYRGLNRVFVPSEKDAQLVSAVTPEVRLHTDGLPLHYTGYMSDRATTREHALLFWGALSRSENADGARWLLREVFPRVRHEVASAKLLLAGSNPPPDLIATRSTQIEVPGFVEDPGPFFARAHIAVLPLKDGAGVKVKVLECLASGMPVLTTDVGAEGIDAGPEDGLIVLPLDADIFAREASRLLTDASARAALADAAFRWAQRQSHDHRARFLQGGEAKR